jgi:hypothetical protein
MIKECIKDYKATIENREKAIKEMSKTGRYIIYFGMLLFLSSLVLIPFLTIPFFQNFISQTTWAWFGGLEAAGVTCVFIGGAINWRRGIPQTTFSSEDIIFLPLFEALTSFETYKKDSLELAKFQCIKKLNKVRSLMRLYWKPSDIAVVTKEIGNEIETFKEKFDENLIFILKNSRTKNEEKIKVIDSVLNEFGEYLIEPNKERLVELNKKIDSLHPEDVKPIYSLSDFVRQRQSIRHILVTIVILVASLSPAFYGFYYMHVTVDTAILVFAAIFGPLMAVYFAYVLRKH